MQAENIPVQVTISIKIHILSVLLLLPAAALSGRPVAEQHEMADTVSGRPVAERHEMADTAAISSGTADTVSRAERLATAASLMKVYDFTNALGIYERLLSEERDSSEIVSLARLKVLADNGVRMMDYAYEPTVVARHRFSSRDFFLYYPTGSAVWASSPNVLDPSGDRNAPAIFYRESDGRIVWSSKVEDGTRDLMVTEKLDSVWSLPASVGEALTSSGNEIWPVLSKDGRRLYFASDGLYGVGGYDLYVSEFDDETGQWGVPSNLGFPFSSPGNDLLYLESEDERYSLFASDRDCGKDSIDVYVLAYDAKPLRHRIDDPVRLCGLAMLNPEENIAHIDTGSSTATEMEDNADIRRYMEKMEEVRMLKDSLTLATRELNERRAIFASSDDDDLRAAMIEEIMARERALPVLQEAAAAALSELQAIELDFLFKGVVLDPEKLMKKAEREVVGSTAAYTFSRMEAEKLPEMVFEPASVEEDPITEEAE